MSLIQSPFVVPTNALADAGPSSPQPESMQDVLDQNPGVSFKDIAAQRGQSLLEALQLNATLTDTLIQQETVLTHQTEMITIMVGFINEHLEAGTITPQLSELADKITSSNAYAATAWMSDKL
jgi:hypothetical protein